VIVLRGGEVALDRIIVITKLTADLQLFIKTVRAFVLRLQMVLGSIGEHLFSIIADGLVIQTFGIETSLRFVSSVLYAGEGENIFDLLFPRLHFISMLLQRALVQ